MANAPPWGMCRSRRTQRWWGRHWGIWDISPNTWAKTLWKRRSVRRQWGRQSGSSQIWTGLTSAKSGPGAPLLSYIFIPIVKVWIEHCHFPKTNQSQKEVCTPVANNECFNPEQVWKTLPIQFPFDGPAQSQISRSLQSGLYISFFSANIVDLEGSFV